MCPCTHTLAGLLGSGACYFNTWGQRLGTCNQRMLTVLKLHAKYTQLCSLGLNCFAWLFMALVPDI